MKNEVTTQIIKCSTPLAMITTICKVCARNQPRETEDDEFEIYYPRKKFMSRSWECNGFIGRDEDSSGQ